MNSSRAGWCAPQKNGRLAAAAKDMSQSAWAASRPPSTAFPLPSPFGFSLSESSSTKSAVPTSTTETKRPGTGVISFWRGWKWKSGSRWSWLPVVR